jgi:cytochrome o ubiquinol oxidase subunit 2
VNYLRYLMLIMCGAVLSGCSSPVLDPAGDIAVQQRDLLIDSTLLMLLIIIPVILLTISFAWFYRASNKEARYEPEWEHSIHLELIIWAGPLLIIICLGALTWVGTHLLDPYRQLTRTAANNIEAPKLKPLVVDVIALDWKWLFVYPEYGIATINELAAPVDRPIDFHITSSNVMNSFYIPALAGQIYAMPAMETRLHGVINRVGDYQGFSANYSGAGFSGMHFVFHGTTEADFDKWIANIKAGGGTLDRATYLSLVKPSENNAVQHFATSDAGLYDAVLRLCIANGTTCTTDMQDMDDKKQPDNSGHLMPTNSGKAKARAHHSMSMPMPADQ